MYKNIKTISIEFCTDEKKYTVPDSHYIQIPQKIYQQYLNDKNKDDPLYIGIRNSNSIDKCLYFGRVEPSIKTDNSSEDMCLMPGWVMDKININKYGGLIDIVLIKDHMKKLGYIKIKGNVSSYAKWDDIKERLEEKLSQYNCINVDDVLYVDNVIFTILELKDLKGNNVKFGSTFNTTVNLDFEVPDDIKEKEELLRAELLKKEEMKKIPSKPREVQSGRNLMTFNDLNNQEKKEYFIGTGNKLTSEKIIYPSKEERAKLLEKLIGKV